MDGLRQQIDILDEQNESVYSNEAEEEEIKQVTSKDNRIPSKYENMSKGTKLNQMGYVMSDNKQLINHEGN